MTEDEEFDLNCLNLGDESTEIDTTEFKVKEISDDRFAPIEAIDQASKMVGYKARNQDRENTSNKKQSDHKVVLPTDPRRTIYTEAFKINAEPEIVQSFRRFTSQMEGGQLGLTLRLSWNAFEREQGIDQKIVKRFKHIADIRGSSYGDTLLQGLIALERELDQEPD